VPPRTSASPLLQALKNEPLTLFGDGKQTRSFQYVSDLIEGGCLLPCLPACLPAGRGHWLVLLIG
jgi:hypothetical protein